MDNKLFFRLQKLRDDLRLTLALSGVSVGVCDDETLKRIAEVVPETSEELMMVKGVNSAFITKFGVEILDCIKTYKSEVLDERELSGYNLAVIEKIENSLKDRLLGGSYITKSQSALIINGTDEIINLFYDKGSIKYNRRTDENFEDRYNQFIKLIKLVDAKKFESGKNELYLGFSIVKGGICGGVLNCYAPLVLVPIKIMLNYNEIKVIKDEKRNILCNSLINALLGISQNAVYKFDKKLGFAELIADIENYYKTLGMKFVENGGYTGFSMQNEVLIDVYDSSLVDILLELQKIKKSKKINKLTDIILGAEPNTSEYISNHTSYYINFPKIECKRVLEQYEENDILAVNSLMGSDYVDTIANVLADNVCKGKNCIVVAKNDLELEKVYSALQSYNKYAVKLFGENCRESFKKQFFDCVEDCVGVENKKNDIFGLDDRMRDIEKDFLNLDQNMFGNSEFASCIKNASLYDSLYLLQGLKEKDEDVENLIAEQGAEIKLVEILNIKRRFENSDYLNKVLRAEEMDRMFPWLKYFKKDLTKKELAEINEFSGAKNHSNKKLIKQFVEKYFINNEFIKFIIENPDKLINSLIGLNDYNELMVELSLLSVTERKFISSVYDTKKLLEVNNIDACRMVIECFLRGVLKRIEGENAESVKTINEYNVLLEEYKALTNKKTVQCRELLVQRLKQSLKDNLVYSKRFKAMQDSINGSDYNLFEMLTKFRLELFDGFKIWFVNLGKVRELPIIANMFDLCIVLQSADIFAYESVGLGIRSKKLIAVADSEQNVRRSENLLTDKNFKLVEPYELTLFDNVSDFGEVVDLFLNNKHKNKVLFDFTNYAFYDGRCKDYNIGGYNGNAVVCINTAGRFDDGINPTEARKVISILKTVLAKGSNKSIVVATFTNAQKYEIIKQINLLSELDAEFAKRLDVYLKKSGSNGVEDLVKTAYELMGVTKELVIFSTVISVNKYRQIEGRDIFDFAGSKALLNLVLTSAINKMIVVTSVEPDDVTKCVGGTLPLQLFATFLSVCKACGDNNVTTIENILNMLKTLTVNNSVGGLIDDLKELLLQNNLNAKVVDNRIIVNDKVIVELESVAKENCSDAIERDLFLPIMLEKTGLRYYKIFDTLLIEDLNLQIEKIKNLSK